MKMESKMVFARGWGEGNGELLFKTTEIQFGKMKTFWTWMVVMVA